MPKVSVIMSVHNGAHYLVEAIDSILNQSLSDFEFIIVDDASDDTTPVILGAYSDPRIILLRNSRKLGLAASLNKAIALSKGNYLVRMDADDVSLPNRLERQVAYMDKNPHIGLLGGALVRIDRFGKHLGGILTKPETDLEIRWAALLENPFAHPTMMIRHSEFLKLPMGYDPSYSTTQDYDLWARMLTITQGANLQEPVLLYRIHTDMVSVTRQDIQKKNSIKISKNSISMLLDNFQVSEETISQLQSILFGGSRLRPPVDADRIGLAGVLLDILGKFSELHSDQGRLVNIHHKVSMHLAHLVLLPPFPEGWSRIAKTAMKLNKGFIPRFTLYFADVLAREMGRRLYMRPKGKVLDRRKILFVVGSLDTGGAERHLLGILPRLDRSRYEANIYTLSHTGRHARQLETTGVRVLPPPPGQWIRKLIPKPVGTAIYLIYSALRLTQIMLTMRPSAVHFFLPTSYIIGSICSFVAFTQMRIMSRRSLNNYFERQPAAAWLEKLLHSRMSAILANSSAVHQQLIEETAPPERVGLLYSGVDTETYTPSQNNKTGRDELGFDENTLILICVANLIPYKGHADLLEALGYVRERMPQDWKLLCIGRNDGIEQNLRSLSAKFDITDNIVWMGERLDVVDLLRMADIAVLCSHEEGFSNSILEAMSSGLPVIATAVGGNVDVVVDGDTGFLVEARNAKSIGEAIAVLSASPELRKKMGNRGRERTCEYFSVERCVVNYEAFYSKIFADTQLPLFLKVSDTKRMKDDPEFPNADVEVARES